MNLTVQTASFPCFLLREQQAELENLEKRWRRRLEMQQRESAKKAAASVAAVAAGRGGSQGIVSSGSASHECSEKVNGGAVSQEENVVARTASWLDRAKSVLKEPTISSNGQLPKAEHIAPAEDIRTQMEEVERLINEGPTIRQKSAALPEMVEKAGEDEDEDVVHRHASSNSIDNMSAGSSDVEHEDKRMRTAEDAEALVGFLRSVRASAAAGHEF